MRRDVEKVDSEVQGFAMNDDAEIVHTELARANVLRLRGDFNGAEEICVRILEHHPESAATQTLLGDIAYSQDRMDQAAEHYEIAYALDPAPDVFKKFKSAEELRETREIETTAEQLGLPPKNANQWANPALAVVAVACLVTAVIFGSRAQNSPRPVDISNHVVAATPDTIAPASVAVKSKPAPAGETTPVTDTAAVTPPADTATTEVPAGAPVPAPVTDAEDRTVVAAIQGHSNYGSRILNVAEDPRTKTVILSFTLMAGEDPKHVGAEIAKTVLDQVGDSQMVTMRAMRDDHLIYQADMPRIRYSETIPETWAQNNPSPDAWITYSIVNEWPIKSPGAPDAPKTP